MNKKAEFDLQTFLVVLVLFIGITVTFGSFAVSLSQSYEPLTGNTVSPEFSNTYNQLSTMETGTAAIQEKVVDTQTGSLDAATEFFGDALNSLKLVGTSLSTTKTLMTDMAKTLNVGEFWFRILSTVLILMVLTVIIFMIFRYRGG
jgi:hypothetical protein